jgi:hypothetical protein
MWKVFDSLETEEILGIELGGNFYSVGGHDDLDDDLDAIKLKIPSFLGKKDPEALCGIGGHGPYSNKGGEADKEKGNTCFQTNSASSSSTWRPNLKREGLSNRSLMQRLNHLIPRRMLIQLGKVNLNLNLLMIEILNV